MGTRSARTRVGVLSELVPATRFSRPPDTGIRQLLNPEVVVHFTATRVTDPYVGKRVYQ